LIPCIPTGIKNENLKQKIQKCFKILHVGLVQDFGRKRAMSGTFFLVVLAILCGIAVTFQGHFMGLLDRGLGTRESVFITYGSGGLIAALMMVASKGGNLREWQDVPWFALTAGVLGLVIVAAIGYVVPRLGLVKGFTIIVASQFVVAALLDHFSLLGAVPRPLDGVRLLGMGMLLTGVWLTVR
jgi:bacterial/archaeal transporter family-2 protein